jgi:hypothetical protein
MRWNLHGLIIEGTTNNATFAARWAETFSPLPRSESPAQIHLHINLTENPPKAPAGEPLYKYEHITAYYRSGSRLQIFYPDFGLLSLDTLKGKTEGEVHTSCLDRYGFLEEVVANGLSPHMRRRGMFMVHAFAAEKRGQFVLLVGDMGVGKTTAGIAFLESGWHLMSNDSPIVYQDGSLRSYPGFLAAFSDSLTMFDGTKALAEGMEATKKREIDPQHIWPDVWRHEASQGLILFSQFVKEQGHSLTPLSRAAALGQLLPHTVDSWDEDPLGNHIIALENLVTRSAAYAVSVGQDPHSLPKVIEKTLEELAAGV